MMNLFNDLMSRVLSATEEYATQHVQLHGPPADPMAVKEFQEGMVQLHTAIQNAVLGEYNLTEETFRQILMKYSSTPEVQGAFMQMQFGIQQKLAMAGIGAGMGYEEGEEEEKRLNDEAKRASPRSCDCKVLL